MQQYFLKGYRIFDHTLLNHIIITDYILRMHVLHMFKLITFFCTMIANNSSVKSAANIIINFILTAGLTDTVVGHSLQCSRINTPGSRTRTRRILYQMVLPAPATVRVCLPTLMLTQQPRRREHQTHPIRGERSTMINGPEKCDHVSQQNGFSKSHHSIKKNHLLIWL